jgi:hypothetical protein
MNRSLIGRFISVLVGGTVLFGLEQAFEVKFYIAIPVAIVAYLAVRLAINLTWGANGQVS